jgi:hypothetical protein
MRNDWVNISRRVGIFGKNPLDRLRFFLTGEGLGLELGVRSSNVGCSISTTYIVDEAVY